MPDEPLPGWYPDPRGQFDQRYWDGKDWTAHVAHGGRSATCAPDADDASAEAVRAGLAPSEPTPPSAPPETWTATATPAGSRRVALLAGVLVALVGVGIAAAVVLGGGDSGTGGPSRVSVFALEVGMCFDDTDALLEGGEIDTLPVVDCDVPHDNEVFAVFDIEDGGFPGTAAVQGRADDGCLDRFRPYVGRDYGSSRLVISHLVPTGQTWASGDREVACFLYDQDFDPLVGTARDSGW